MKPPQELQADFDALTAEQQAKATDLINGAGSVILELGRAPEAERHAWEAVIAEVRQPFDSLPAPEPKPVKPQKPKREPKEIQGHELTFPEIKPWPVPVEGVALLNEIATTYQRFLVLPAGGAEASTLFSVHAHAHDLFEVSPILVFKSPAMRCGKTTALELTHSLIPRPLMVSNMTGPVLFRAIEKYHPALLIDEADSFVTRNDELRGILNSGHRREGAISLRLVGDGHELRAFSTWGPKVIASIGSLAATLEDRAVTVPMKRKARGEKVEKLRLDRLYELEPIRQRIARWVADNADALRDADPNVPETLDDRAADNWRPLLAIADAAGGDWPKRARDAALILSAGRLDEGGAKEQLLADIKCVWPDGTDQMSSADLVEALVALKDRPWAEWNRGRPLTQNKLASMLRGYDIKSRDIRTSDGTLKGYKLTAFTDAFARYVADAVADPVAAQNEPNATLFPAPGLECRVVAVESPRGGAE